MLQDPVPVALLARHDGPLVVGILSVIVAGQVVVVIDPLAPREQQLHVLTECGCPVVVCDEEHRALASDLVDALPDHSARPEVVPLDDLEGDELSPVDRGPNDPVMLAFTSGTSGMSKGGIITHGVILNVVRGATEALGVTSADRMPMLFPTSLAVAAYPLFIPLLNGGTLATLDVRGVGLEPFPRFLIDERITLAYMAPTVIRFLVDAVAGYDFPDLRLLALGGEVVDGDVVRLARELFRPDWLANGFGTTETGVITLHLIDPDDEHDGVVPSGHPVPEVDLRVVDDEGSDVATGESGEIVVSSPHVFAGYWGHAELDDQVLAPDPAGRPGWRAYRTGDLGRIDADGALVVLGRVDTKVKVRGRFVALGDVEAVLHEIPEVGDALVATVVDRGITELCAVVVPALGAAFDRTSVRAALLVDQEPHCVPTRWAIVDELPRLPNGKLDRRAAARLAAQEVPDGTGTDRSADLSDSPAVSRTATAASSTSRELRDLWEELLPVGVVGLDEDFFHLGGDSLLAAQMLVMFEQRTGVGVPMGELLHARTIRTLAEVADRVRRAGGARSTVACVQAGDETARPRLWFVHDLQGSAFRVRHVAASLGSDQPVWSFESPLLRGEPNPHQTLDTFAARYLTDLRSAQPEGPYLLAGYSFGGVCAYEMARQLEREGQDVGLLAVIDVGPGYRGEGWNEHRSPFRPWFGVAKPPPAETSAWEKLGYYRRLFEASPAAAARHLMVRSGVSRVVDPLRFQLDLRRKGQVRPEWRLWYAWEEHWKLAAQQWDRTRPYGGRMDLLWAEQTGSSDATMGWGRLVDDLRINRYVGDHEGTLEPRGADSLAKALRPLIDAAGQGGHF